MQPYFNNKELLDYCKQQGVHLVAYSPLGNFDPSKPELPSAIKDEVVVNIGAKYNKSPAQVLHALFTFQSSVYTAVPLTSGRRVMQRKHKGISQCCWVLKLVINAQCKHLSLNRNRGRC
jgi:diketogulonate reductase-like aldo/keto reductase